MSTRVAWGQPLAAPAASRRALGSPAVPAVARAVDDLGGWELAVVGGPLAGERFPLHRGVQTLGRGADADVRLGDGAVSRCHVRLRAGRDSVVLLAGPGRAAVFVDGRQVEDGHRLELGVPFEVGRSLLVVRRPPPPAATAGRRPAFNRPPIGPPPDPPTECVLPEPPAEPQRVRVPVAAVLAPLAVGAGLWLATGSATGLVLALATPVLAVAPVVEDRLTRPWRRRRQARRYRDALAASCRELERVRRDELLALRAGAPDAAELEGWAERAGPRLWERRPGRGDFLRLRVGWGDVASAIPVTVPPGRPDLLAAAAASASLPAAPLVVGLGEVGVLGLAGPAEAVRGLARWLAVQAAALHSPRELAIAAFGPAGWEWAARLPHTQSLAGPDAGSGDAPAGQRRLAADLAALAADAGERAGRPVLVMVEDGGPVERALLTALLRPGPGRRLHVVWLASSTLQLPDACGAVTDLDDDGSRLRLRRLDTGTEQAGVPDLVGPAYAQRVARSLSAIQDVEAASAPDALPARAGLLACLGADAYDAAGLAAAVRRWWSDDEAGLAAPVGVGAAGVVAIDLRAQGPHALVGGTTGSGKSEFLRAWVTALAARRSPRRVSVLLVDFKGGTAFRDCARLPHVVGMVTDLDDHLLDRVRVSLLAELRRREAALAAAGCKEFIELERRCPDAAPPALVIVFDEFEQLVAQQPDFVAEGVAPIARLGRGLGVHLVLGTQRPQGAVPESIRANANVRVALRMLSEAQSQDVVGASDAARIDPSAHGRAVVRLSHRDLAPVQVAYAGARSIVAGVEGPTDFERIADATAAVAADLGLAPPPRPWLPELPSPLRLDTIAAGALPGDGSAVLGMVDEPRRQLQRPLRHDLAADGHLLIHGPAGSGRSMALRTLACSLAAAQPPERLRIYGIDCSGGALRPLEALPHTCVVAGPDEPERMAQVLRLLGAEVAVRRRQLRAAAPATWRDIGLPAILLLLDDHASFHALFERFDGGRYAELVEALLRDGRPVGVHGAISTSTPRDLAGLLATAVPRRIALQPSRQEWDGLGLPTGPRPGPAWPPGRGFAGGLEVQIAVLADGTPAGEAAATVALGARLAERCGGLVALRLDALPDEVLAVTLPAPLGPLRAVIGLGGDTVVPVVADVGGLGSLIVAGPRGSGRTTALAAVAASLARAPEPARRVLLTSRRHSELSARGPWWREAGGPDACRELASALVAELEGDDIPPTVVIVDDGDLLVGTPAEAPLRDLARLGRDAPVRLVVAVETRALRRYSDWLGELRESRHALLLHPDVAVDGEPFGAGPLPRPLRPWPQGRGFHLRGGQATLTQVGC